MTNNTNTEYNVTVLNSSRALTRRESVKFGSTTGMTALKAATDNGLDVMIVNPQVWAKIHIHNERAPVQADGSRNTDYDNIVVIDAEGHGYFTGSPSFEQELMRIWGEMADDDGNPAEDFNLRVFQRKSQKNAGNFLTATIE